MRTQRLSAIFFGFSLRGPAWSGLLVLIACVLMAGCGVEKQIKSALGVKMQGTVMGGQQPISGSQVYMFAAGDAGYGTAATSLLTGSGVSNDANGNGYVTTDSNGVFKITGDYTCPSGSGQIYLVARGGNPGLSGNVNNTSIAELAMVGTCSSLTSSTSILIDERTTALAAVMLAQFANIATGASGSNREWFATNSTNTAGFATGVQTAQYVLAQGASAGFNTLADIIATCVNSNGTTGECTSLFGATTPPAGTRPQDTLEALISIARNPAINPATLFSLILPQAPFQPTYTSAPNNWLQTGSAQIQFGNKCSSGAAAVVGGGNNLLDEALDAMGRLWTGLQCTTVASVDTGVIYGVTDPTTTDQNANFGLSGFMNQMAYAFAVDQTGVVWYLDTNSSSAPIVANFSPSTGTYSQIMSPSAKPSQFGVDAHGGVWLAEGMNFETGIPASYTSPPTAMHAGNGTVVAMAFDSASHLWTANKENTLSRYTISGTSFTASALYTGGSLSTPGGIAIDHAGNVWVTSTAGNRLSKFDNSGNAASGGYGGGGMNGPVGIAVDGDGNIWVASPGAGVLSKFDGNGDPLSPGTGYALPKQTSESFQIDNVGNVWFGTTVVYGAAAPVTTPISAAVAGSKLGTRP